MSGLRRDTASTAASTSSNTATSEHRSTLSGSTAQHGPRFKRYRLQSSGIKEVPEEQVSMVEETSEAVREECFFNTACAGEAIVGLWSHENHRRRRSMATVAQRIPHGAQGHQNREGHQRTSDLVAVKSSDHSMM